MNWAEDGLFWGKARVVPTWVLRRDGITEAFGIAHQGRMHPPKGHMVEIS